MKFISLTLIVFLFCGTETNGCSSNANKNEEGREDCEDCFEITGSIQKAKEEYDNPMLVTIQWRNFLSMFLTFL